MNLSELKTLMGSELRRTGKFYTVPQSKKYRANTSIYRKARKLLILYMTTTQFDASVE